MRVRIALLAASAAVGLVTVPGHAAGHRPQIVDIAGDANFVNGQDQWQKAQGAVGAIPDSPDNISTGPASYPPADILSLGFTTQSKAVTKTVHGRRRTSVVPTGFTLTLTLAAPPATGIYYWVFASTDSCPNAGLWWQYGGSQPSQTQPVPKTHSTFDCIGFLSDRNYAIKPAVVKGNSIIWTVPLALVAKDLPAGSPIKNIVVETKVSPTGTGINSLPPIIDRASTTKAYVVGS